MHPRTPLAFALPTLPAFLPAQVLPGDIAVTGFSTSAFGIATPPALTAYVTPSFQGTGGGTSQAILHWGHRYNEFFVGGFGFIGTAVVTGPGTVTYTLLTNGIGTAAQMSFDSANNIVVADAGTDQVRSISMFGGPVTDLSVGPQPWGANINAGAWDPRTGDVIVGGSGALYRLANSTTSGVLLAAGLGGFVSAVAFDPLNGDVLATVLASNRIVRVDTVGTVTDVVSPGTVTGPNALTSTSTATSSSAATPARSSACRSAAPRRCSRPTPRRRPTCRACR
jgi:hypothetical protein